MVNYIIRRLLIAIPVIFLMVAATFALIQATPGGPFDASGQKAMPEHIKNNLEQRYGLDKPVWEQFTAYIGNLLRGDLGPLFRNRTQTVNENQNAPMFPRHTDHAERVFSQVFRFCASCVQGC